MILAQQLEVVLAQGQTVNVFTFLSSFLFQIRFFVFVKMVEKMLLEQVR